MSQFENSTLIPKISPYGDIRMLLATEAVMDLAVQANGDRAIRSILEHDPHYLPVGKIAKVLVEEKEEHFVVQTTIDDSHDIRRFHHPSTDDEMVEVTFTNDDRPFARLAFSPESRTVDANADLANFSGMSAYNTFVAEAEDPSDLADHAGMLMRRSLTPEPLIQFIINDPILSAVLGWIVWRGGKFLTYTIDQTLRKAGEEISEVLSRRIRNVIKKFDEHRANDDRPVTSHIVVQRVPEIHLLTRCYGVENNTDIGLASLCKQLEAHKDLLESAESVTLARENRNEDWKVLYIETAAGTVVAPAKWYEATSEAYEKHKQSFPICLCLKHKDTGEERHYKTSAVFTEISEDGHFQMQFNSYPNDIQQWEIVEVVIERGGQSHLSG